MMDRITPHPVAVHPGNLLFFVREGLPNGNIRIFTPGPEVKICFFWIKYRNTEFEGTNHG